MLPTERIGRKSLGIDGTQNRLNLEMGGMAEKNVLTLNIDDTLRSVTDLIVTQNSTYCLIMAFDEVQGIITYRDIIMLLGERSKKKFPFSLLAYRTTHSMRNLQNQNLQI
jgi:hypothetical protein